MLGCFGRGKPSTGSALQERTATFYWIATESRRARMMRKFIEGHLGVPRDWIRSTGYWKAHPDEADGD